MDYFLANDMLNCDKIQVAMKQYVLFVCVTLLLLSTICNTIQESDDDSVVDAEPISTPFTKCEYFLHNNFFRTSIFAEKCMQEKQSNAA